MKTIFCIDDEQAIQEVIKLALEPAGYNVLSAIDPDTGASMLKEHSVDLVLLDLGLPGKSGFTLYRELEAIADVPVLFLSGCSRSFNAKSPEFTDLYQNEFLEGRTDILYKPFTLALLFEKIESLVGVCAN